MSTTVIPTLDDDGIPASWSASARETLAAVLDERPDLTSAETSSLWHACTLETAADALDLVAAAAGYVSTGSTGQTIVHPAVVEARLARTAAAAILSRLTPASSSPRSEAARTAARARWSGSGRR